jgi:predicted lipoprotein with Yx(FWY)xxD motif
MLYVDTTQPRKGYTQMKRLRLVSAILIVLSLVIPLVGYSSPAFAAPSGPQSPAWLKLYKHAEYGYVLSDGKGWVLYSFAKDTPGVSNCSGACAEVWPPYLIAPGQQPQADWAGTYKLGVYQRPDGYYQVTYNDVPLYYYAQDKNPGDALGNGYAGIWSVVPVKYNPAEARTYGPQSPAWLKLYKHAQWGYVLTDGYGWILYSYAKDTPGVSTCVGACADVWPPYLIAYGEQPKADWAGSYKLGVYARPDGKYQVTYNDIPLYYYSQDKQPGEGYGNGYGGVWSIIAVPYTPPAYSTPAYAPPTPPYNNDGATDGKKGY